MNTTIPEYLFKVFLGHSIANRCVVHCSVSCRQDIVEDERSDKDETESEDEDEDKTETSKNGHVQNGHTMLNNNHRKIE